MNDDGAPTEDHPSSLLDDTVHQRVRLGILSMVSGDRSCEFGYLRDQLGVTDGNLSRHLSVLSEADMVVVEKGYDGKRPKTWVWSTPTGERALRDEISALRRIIDSVAE